MLSNTKIVSALLNVNKRAHQRVANSSSSAAPSVSVRFAEEQDSDQITTILWDAFKGKMIRFAATIEEFKETTRAQDLVKERILVATKDDSGDVLGTVGFSINGQQYMTPSLWDLVKRRGLTKGAAAWFVTSVVMDSRAKPNELYVAAIAVSPAARGLGVGSVLMDAMEEFAIAEGKSQLRLHVVDENPDARRLYEKLGYRVSQTLRLGPLSYLIGTQKAHEMIKPLK